MQINNRNINFFKKEFTGMWTNGFTSILIKLPHESSSDIIIKKIKLFIDEDKNITHPDGRSTC